MFNDSSTDDYSEFLKSFLDSGYRFSTFEAIRNHEKNHAVLRHDIDFDCELAYKMAQIENEFSVKAIYFFLVSSESYNVASPKNRAFIERIKNLGHEISIHFDPLVYENFEEGFECEKMFFEKLFGVDVKIVSIHRPNPFFLEYDQPIGGVEHTYQSKYFADLKYFADSTGVWRFGHPCNSAEFAEGKNLHVLIHPLWWMMDETQIDNVEKIKRHYVLKVAQVKRHYADNCKPFQKIYDLI